MKNGRRMVVLGAASLWLLGLAGSPAMAGSHSWDINEVFSNADGTVQFIELKECCGANNEVGLNNKWVSSETTGNQFDFPGNLPCNNCTANKHLLLATAEFAALPGAPTPDYIIPAGFFSINGDTLDYWFYDTLTFERGELPTDCVNSLNADGTTGPNSPTNFDDETGSINACPSCQWDLDDNGTVGATDLLSLLVSWGPCKGCPADFDGNGSVGATDLLALLVNWGPCP